eukprot:434654-Amphidinium_carterae.1
MCWVFLVISVLFSLSVLGNFWGGGGGGGGGGTVFGHIEVSKACKGAKGLSERESKRFVIDLPTGPLQMQKSRYR